MITEEEFAQRLATLMQENAERLGVTSGNPTGNFRADRTIIKAGNVDRDWFFVDVERSPRAEPTVARSADAQ